MNSNSSHRSKSFKGQPINGPSGFFGYSLPGLEGDIDSDGVNKISVLRERRSA